MFPGVDSVKLVHSDTI